MTNAAASLPASVEVDGFTIHKLKLGEWARAAELMQGLPGTMVQVLAIATRLPEAEVDERMGAVTASKCIKAMMDINDFLGAAEEMKALAASAKNRPSSK